SLSSRFIDGHECRTILDAVRWLGTDYAVVTSVTRDDLPDGGAGQFAEVVGSLRGMGCRVEVLVPDFRGNEASIGTVLGAGPDVVGHNMETTADLYTAIRPMSDYAVGLSVLETIKRLDSDMPTKSGFMLGLGESMTGVKGLMQDIRSTGCDMLTIGQYLRPSSENVEVREYVRPEVFGMLEEYAYSLGFRAVRASPLSRSSLGAREMWLRTANSRTFYDEKQEKEDVC
ncbi:MAG: lipoyl synthase, partial [Deltaproteobacteria bacterium]|nr:lipoyl synthase [Deltaproteobacteria bacterium]